MKALQRSGMSQREACKVIRAGRRSPRHQPSAKTQADARIIVRLTELAQRWPRRGCKRLYDRYERDAQEGDVYMNFKRFRRLYRLANLQLHRRRRRSRAKYVRGLPLRRANRPHEIWAMDFLADRLLFGRRFRVHTLLDECSRYPFSIFGACSFPSTAVVMKLEEAARDYGYPRCLRVDNGPEHIASSAKGVAVNGCLLPHSRAFSHDAAGRRLSPWPHGHFQLRRGELWLYAANGRSWDSRYFGPLKDTNAVARAFLLRQF